MRIQIRRRFLRPSLRRDKMKKFLAISMLTSASIMLAACEGAGNDAEEMSFLILDAQGSEIGLLEIEELAAGGVEVGVDVRGLTPGIHAMHFHEFGRCDGPDFKSAGGHYNPAGVAHGQVEDGPHAGDMMNVEIAADGTGKFEVTNEKVNLRAGSLPALMDSDGTALIIHGGADDYTSQPSGAAGPRVACAVIPAG
jgi:Cu-Zn family superoxide dismutase